MIMDYAFYRDEYHGKSLDEAEFERLSIKAEAYLDKITFGRAGGLFSGPDPPEALVRKVRLACCAVADALLLNEQGGGIVSETVGKYSVNYASGISNTGTDASRLRSAAGLFLAGTGLTYSGV